MEQARRERVGCLLMVDGANQRTSQVDDVAAAEPWVPLVVTETRRETGMDAWDEIRTVFHVARLGTISAAASFLGVHHATVIRHVDALEARLGTKFFQRHARGYTPTEAGRDLLAVAQEADDRFAQLAARVGGQGDGAKGAISGELVVTSIITLSRLITPALVELEERHPGLTVRYLTDTRLFRLEAGEAHVAVRAGAQPDSPDNVVQPFLDMRFALVASDAYVTRHGMPDSEADLARHRFVAQDESDNRGPMNRWLEALVPGASITHRVLNDTTFTDAVVAGAGIGFVTQFNTAGRSDLHEVLPAREEWRAPLWLVTHVDLHRTPKVQAALSLLKERAKAWT